MKIKYGMTFVLAILVFTIFGFGCKIPVQPQNVADSAADTPVQAENPGIWKIVRQLEVEQKTTLAGFYNENFGITVGYGGTVYYTTDAGETWIESNNDSWCRYGLDIVDEDIAWSIGNGGHVRISTDGGRNWEAVSDLSYKKISKSISFLDTQTGWAASTAELWATSDEGQTWVDVPLPEPDVIIAAVELLTVDNGYLLDYTGNLYITGDGGNSWTSKTLEMGGDKIDVLTNPAMLFLDAENGIIVTKLAGKNLAVLRTSDGGETWEREDVPDIAYLTQPYLYLSTDGKILTVTLSGNKFIVLSYSK